MSNPVLANPEQENCCFIGDEGNPQCEQKARFWVGNGWDDYTHVCGDHVESVRCDGDVVADRRVTMRVAGSA